jgi:hypothetical protein
VILRLAVLDFERAFHAILHYENLQPRLPRLSRRLWRFRRKR